MRTDGAFVTTIIQSLVLAFLLHVSCQPDMIVFFECNRHRRAIAIIAKSAVSHMDDRERRGYSLVMQRLPSGRVETRAHDILSGRCAWNVAPGDARK